MSSNLGLRLNGYLFVAKSLSAGTTVMGKPSLTCNFQELYRYLVDDFVIQFCQRLKKEDFVMKSEGLSAYRKGEREDSAI